MRARIFNTALIISWVLWLLISANGQTVPQKAPALYPFVENDKFGYLDEKGQVAIKPQFDDAKRFSEGLARVRAGKLWGFIDQNGNVVIAPQFEIQSIAGDANEARLDFHEGRAAVSLNDGRKWGYIDQAGKVVIKPQFDHADRFSEGIALVSDNYSEKRGNENYMIIGGRGRYVDKQGNVVRTLIVGDRFVEGLARAEANPDASFSSRDDDRKVGFIDKTGRFRIAPRLWAPESFSEGLAPVRAYDRSQWGYINRQGRMVIKMIYQGAGGLHEGLARVDTGNMLAREGEHMAFIDRTGRMVISPKFLAVGNFSGGLASACVTDSASAWRMKCGYIDRTGKWVIQPGFIFILGDFMGELAWACTELKCGYIDRRGKFVWTIPVKLDESEKPIFTSPLTGCSLISSKPESNYPCTFEFKIF